VMLKVNGLSVQLSPDLSIQYPDIEVKAGDRWLISGASGTGKSTLLNAVSGAILPQNGFISFLDHDYSGLSSRKVDQLRADHMGIIFQQLNLIPYLNGFQNAELGLQFSRRRQLRLSNPKAEILRLANALGLDESQLIKPSNQLSIGQQQRVAVIRAFLGEPELILADEPTSALDPKSRDLFLDEVLNLLDPERQAILMISHDPHVAPHFNQTMQLS
jgi:putative ABC transport system ATP-binding protein